MIQRLAYGVNGIECEAILNNNNKTIPIILLHGYSFRGKIWVDIGLITKLEERGIDYAAPDMPYGKLTSCTKKTRNIEVNVRAVETIMTIFFPGRIPIILGASLGGRIALYYAVKHKVAGLFLASPAIKENERVWDLLKRINIPVIIIRGSKDFIPKETHEKLAHKLDAKLIEYDNSGHAMYLNKPEKFITDLLEFYERVKLPL